MREGDKFPPVDVFHDGIGYYLADGFHRFHAARRCAFLTILANVHKGTVADAVWFSIGANKTNGLRRKPGDKRRAIEIALQRFPEKTQQAIAEQVGCSQRHVGSIQAEFRSSSKLTIPTTRTGTDGKSYPTTGTVSFAVVQS